jgi:hypothetical protein
MRARLGAPKAITATAHKPALIIYHMIITGHAHDETICTQNEVQNRRRLEARLRRQTRQIGLQVVAYGKEDPPGIFKPRRARVKKGTNLAPVND